VCGNSVFTLFTTDCVFQHRLIQYLVIELFRFYNEDTVDRHLLPCSAKDDDENNLGQILEVLTPAQGYLMFFNNRGLTTSSLVSLSNPYTSSQPIPYFSLSVL
jgi:hypothetical protein